MTSKERMLIAMKNGQADMVPVAPDMSNMIPCKLTGKPFWDIYLYRDPPREMAYIDAVKHFGFDGWLNSVPKTFWEEEDPDCRSEEVIVFQSGEKIITRTYTERPKNGREWSPRATVYYRDNPPTTLSAEKIGLETPPEKFSPVKRAAPQKKDEAILAEVKEYMGDQGVVGIGLGLPCLGNPEMPGTLSIYDYCDRYEEVKRRMLKAEQDTLRRLARILAAKVRPDFILTGGSGLLIFNTPKIVRDITLPALQKVTRMCRDAGMPSQIHCCGPERALVQMSAEETDLDSINPLEIPPMGDCDLRELKQKFGRKLSLMGNLHTTDVMLRGSVRDVEAAAKKAIDDAAEGGGFILSTGDQCGRDTPEENIFKLIEVARTYGRY